MLPMPQLPGPRCDCCGAFIQLQAGDFCPRCGYPVTMPREAQFLEESIRNLQRVATYGGAQATVTNLLLRYRTRLSVVRQQLHATASRQNASLLPQSEVVLPSNVGRPVSPLSMDNQVPSATYMPHVSAEQASVTPPIPPVQKPLTSTSSAPQEMFSLRSFFADQTINIVSSLGAFLILIGSLSFVATTTNLFLSFLVLLLVHLVFATVGFVFARFPGFRFISRVYTAVFALLVPLVGFSVYRLVAGHLIQLSAPTVVAIAAIYAAIVYASLAITQQYKPFGYLASVAVVVADLSVAFALHLAYWWWPVLLMPLAFLALLSASKNVRLFHHNRAVLREPMLVLMYACIAVLCVDILYTYPYLLVIEVTGRSFLELRVAGAVMLLLVLTWTCAYLLITKQFAWLVVVPYQLLGLVVALAYVFEVQAIYYGLLFTALAVCYHVGVLIARNPLQRFQQVRNHMEGIALVLVVFIPFLVAPLVPLNLLEVVYSGHDIQFPGNGNTFFALIALFVGCVLTVSIALSHTGLRRIPLSVHPGWRWLLLLSGLLLTWVYSVVVLSFHIDVAYEFLALTLVLLLGTIIVRRFISASWSNPLDVLVLGETALTLLLHIHYGIDANLALLFFFAVLSYSVLVYQRRYIWLFIPMLFMLLAFPALLERPRILLLLAMSLPLVALVLIKIEQHRRGVADTTTGNIKVTRPSLLSWEWPVLVSGLFYGVIVCGVDVLNPMSTVQNWFGVPFSVALEMASLALLWYAVAALTRQQWMLLVTIGFAVAGLLVPSNPLWVLVCIAGVMALLAVGIGRIVAKTWTIPLYSVALLAAVLMGMDGYTHGQLALVSWLLLGFALLMYAIGAIENFSPFLWLAAVFAIWSVYDAALLGDVYRAPVIALLSAAIGVGISCLAFTSTFFTPRKGALLRFSLPLYVTALAAATLTGVYGVLGGINVPFPTAIPDALLLYALVAYAVLIFERQARWLLLVAVFALWGTVLVARLNADLFMSISAQIAFPTYYLTGVALVAGGIALAMGRLRKTRDVAPSSTLTAFTWSWPWYCASLFAIALTLAWNTFMGGVHVAGVTVYSSIFAFILLTCIVIVVERKHELLILPIALALWGIVQAPWEPWQQLGALSVLFFLVFVAHYIWHLLPSQNPSQDIWYTRLSFVGQVGILLVTIGQGGLSSYAGALAHIGIGVLLLLAVQLFLYGWTQPRKHYWTIYTAGLLVALAIPWELATFQLTRIEWLTLAPATYLIVIAPFLSRNEHLVQHHRLGQLCSILGASLLLLPTLWSSFNEPNMQPTLILAGEALALLLLGVTLRTRFFVLSGAALVIVSAMHALFLPSLGLPPSLALTIVGVTLLALATALSLARHRLQIAWTRLD